MGTPATIQQILAAISDIIAYLVGGTVGSGNDAVSITFANSWVGSFLSTLTSSNGLLFIAFILSISLFGLHVLKSLMNR